jgi:hypothetical protein
VTCTVVLDGVMSNGHFIELLGHFVELLGHFVEILAQVVILHGITAVDHFELLKSWIV